MNTSSLCFLLILRTLQHRWGFFRLRKQIRLPSAQIFILSQPPFSKWAGFNHVSANLIHPPSKKRKNKKTMNAEAPSVNCKWVLKNWHSHLGSTSHPSQTNEAPSASKWDWSPFETRHRTLGFWILRKVPLSMETRVYACPPPPSSIPSSTGVM